MTNCFVNLIGLEGLSPEVTPRGGLYINHLQGITLGMFQALTNEDRDGTFDFWNKIYDRAVINFITEVASRLDNSFYVEKVLESHVSGQFNKPFEINDSLEMEAGVKIEVTRSKYSTTEIQTIKIYSIGSPDPENVVVSIVDDQTEEILWTSINNLTEGVNSIDVFESFDATIIRVVYLPSEIASYTTSKEDYNKYQSKKFCNTCCDGDSTIEQINGGGLIVEFNTKCSVEKFICSRISQFKVAFRWWLGVELMKEALMSRETNCFTIDRKEAQDNLGVYLQEFDNALSSVLKNMKIKDDHLCFDCSGTVTKRLLLP